MDLRYRPAATTGGRQLSPAGDEGDHDVGGVTVEPLAAVVVHRRRAWIGVAGGELDVARRHPGIQSGHDERRSEHVRVDMAEPRPPTDRAHPTMGAIRPSM
jgi:hypothetical protein